MPSCVPQDTFWDMNRVIAHALWQQGDGATISTRIAEGIHTATGAPIKHTKTALHGVGASTLGIAIAKSTGSTLLGLLVGVGLFVYLERDRC